MKGLERNKDGRVKEVLFQGSEGLWCRVVGRGGIAENSCGGELLPTGTFYCREGRGGGSGVGNGGGPPVPALAQPGGTPGEFLPVALSHGAPGWLGEAL